jgi:hypothetical protein
MIAINFLWNMSSKFSGGEGPARELMVYSRSYIKIISNSLTVAWGADAAGAVSDVGGANGEVEAVAPGVVGAGDIVLQTWNAVRTPKYGRIE